jgi:hypothetical protein
MTASDAAITMGVLIGSFLFVACFAFVISRMARAKQRARLISGEAFAVIRTEDTRFNGKIKRIHIVSVRPTVEQMFELQDYYVSSECGKGWETEAIQHTFKNMQLLGYDVKLYRVDKNSPIEGQMKEVELSKLPTRLAKDVKKEVKRLKKKRQKSGGNDEHPEEEVKEGDFSSVIAREERKQKA